MRGILRGNWCPAVIVDYKTLAKKYVGFALIHEQLAETEVN